MYRNRSLVRFAALLCVILAAAGSVLLFGALKNRQGQLGHRAPLPPISYCSPDDARPCIVSFTLDRDGKMSINIQTESTSSTDFDVQIKHGEAEKLYTCRRTGAFSTSVVCIGDAMPAGEALQFLVLSRKDHSLLAEGTFPIIGLALATPEAATTPTVVPAWNRPPK